MGVKNSRALDADLFSCRPILIPVTDCMTDVLEGASFKRLKIYSTDHYAVCLTIMHTNVFLRVYYIINCAKNHLQQCGN